MPTVRGSASSVATGEEVPLQARRSKRGMVALLIASAVYTGCGSAGDPNQSSTPRDAKGAAASGIDWLGSVHRCLVDRGWPVVLSVDGTSMSAESVPLEQQVEFARVSAACEETAGPYPVRPLPTAQQLRAEYERLIGVARCLESEGYAVSEPPSFEPFADSYAFGPWHPYQSLRGVSNSEWERLNAACPQSP